MFIYIGTLIPWSTYSDLSIPLEPWRLVILAVLILLLKRLPWVVLLHHSIPALEDRPQAVFAGWRVSRSPPLPLIRSSSLRTQSTPRAANLEKFTSNSSLMRIVQVRTDWSFSGVLCDGCAQGTTAESYASTRVLFITFGSTFAHVRSLFLLILEGPIQSMKRRTRARRAHEKFDEQGISIPISKFGPKVFTHIDRTTSSTTQASQSDGGAVDEERGEGGRRDGLMQLGNQNIEDHSSNSRDGEKGGTGEMSRSYAKLLRLRAEHPSSSEVSIGGIDKPDPTISSPTISPPTSTRHSNHSRTGSIAGGSGANGARVEYVIPEST